MVEILFRQVVISLLIIILAIAITTAVFGVGVYHFGWENRATRTFARIVPSPIAVVNNQFISLSSYFERLEAYKSLVNLGAPFDLEKQKLGIIDGLVEDIIVASEAEKRGIVVSSAKTDRYLRHLLTKFDIPESFDMNEKRFKKNIVEPDVRRKELAVNILQSDINTSVWKKARNIHDRLDKGEDFTAVAESVSDDENSKFIGGDLGFLAYVELNPWLADVAFNLNAGERSDILASPEGLHIIQVIEKEVRGLDGKIHVRQIFIKSDHFAEFLKEVKKDYRVSIFAKI